MSSLRRRLETLELYREIVASAREGMAVFDGELSIVLLNAAMEELLGRTASDTVGNRASVLFDDDEVARSFASCLQQALTGRGCQDEELVLPTPDGERRWISVNFMPLTREHQGGIDGVLVAAHDITGRKLAEQMLRRSTEFNRQVIDSAQEGIAVFDGNLRQVVFNPYMQRITGLSAERALGAHPQEIYGDAAQETVALLQRVLAGETVHREEAPIVSSDAAPRWVAEDFVPLRAGGHVTGVLQTSRDITALKESLRQVEEAHERTSRALAAARMGVWEMDLDTQRVTWTENLPSLFGQESIGTEESFSGLQYIHADDAERVRRAREKSIAELTDLDEEFRVVMPDGSIRWLHAAAHIISGANGNRSRLLGVTIDVTERRLLESQFRQSQKMEAVGLLAGGVAHDFNNLLTAILGYSRFLLEGLTDAEQRSDVEEIIHAADRATALTRQLLAFSRRQQVEPRMIDVADAVNDLARMLQRLIGPQIPLVTESPLPAHVWMDPTQLEQVVVNLVVNARDAMPSGGRIVIKTGIRRLLKRELEAAGLSQPGEYVVLTVTDTGTGMTEETRARLFEPFFTTKERGKGTGLGLATVYGIVTQAKGAIDVDSAPGRGSSFHVYLPAATGLPRVEEKPAAPATTKGTGTLVLVEDEAAVRHLARVILERAGYKVIEFGAPVDALEAFPRIPDVAALVTDVAMPGMSGRDLFRQLVLGRRDLVVVYMSGYTDGVISDQEALGPNEAFVQKPFTPEALLLKVREVVNGR